MARKIVIILGRPGSGKGTQARLVAERCRLPHISTGEMLRQAIARGAQVGQQVRDVMASGALVPDGLMREVVRDRILQPDCRSGFLLDGYPRTSGQVADLDEILRAADSGSRLGALLIDVSPEVLRRRLSGRRSCGVCGKVFNIYENPSAKGDCCDDCGGALLQRPDDSEAVVLERLRVYEELTAPILDHYRRLGLLTVLEGNREVEAVLSDVVRYIEAL